jgi:hypothetical protein
MPSWTNVVWCTGPGGQRLCVLLGVVAYVAALLVTLLPSSAWALSRGPKVSASFVAFGSEVDAGGTDGWL